MKTKLSLRKFSEFSKTPRSGVSAVVIIILLLALSPAPPALSQIPQGFNYQAVARDASGTSIVNTPLPVRITIQSDSLGGNIFWQELHADVVSNSLGIINLVIGKGARQALSTVPLFSDIDWSVSQKFIKTEINYSGWKTMGVSRLWSVPYSLVAEDLAGSVKRLTVTGETENMEEALFEVKNKTGQTVFAVYNEGVRVYVSDGDAKGLKGGFAVGGFGTDKAESTKYMFVGKDSVRIYLDTNPQTKKLKSGFAVGGYDLTKGTVQNYLDVSADSVRIYIDSNPEEKKVKGGFAVGGYDLTKGITGDYFNVSGKSDAEIINGESMVLWYPAKEAFLAGNVLIESKDSVGLNSWASGYQSKAVGNYSQALGYQAIASKDFSTAIGKNAVAHKINSFAFGENANAGNEESYAFGRGAIAEGFRSYALGSAGIDSAGQVTGVAYAKGNYSFAIGQGSQSLGFGSVAMGLADTAGGQYSLAMGYNTAALGYGSTTMGYKTIASGSSSTALNSMTEASGASSLAMGYSTKAIGHYSTAMGCFTTASGRGSTVMGLGTTASGDFSVAIGRESSARGETSIAIGRKTTAAGRFSTSIGYDITAPSAYETVLGCYNTIYTPVDSMSWLPEERLFTIGNGDFNERKNAITILKNGNMAIGHDNPTQVLDINGQIRIRGGNPATGKVLKSYSDGTALWEFINASDLNGVLPVSGGGTGTSSLTQYKLLFGNGTSEILAAANLHWDDYFGRLGIGTTNPGHTVHIVNKREGAALRGESTYSSGIQYGGAFTANSGSVGYGCDAAGSLYDFFAGGAG
ncbi:MAG: hypothetical protein RBT64_14560, partial [Trichloromonas sp.]|nr:hypothetical protein [Trichloromonas sp.]